MIRPTPLVLLLVLPAVSVFAGPRVGAGSISREGPRGGSVEAQGVRAGRFATGSVEAEGPRGGTYEASGTRVGRYRTGSVSAEGPNGASVNKSWSTWNGYRSGYVFTGGVYRPANVRVNAFYVAPVGVFVGWNVMARPYYVTYPAFATYPVEISVQVELQRRGYYGGPIDGDIGPQTQNAIARFQGDNGLPRTGQINEALLKALNVI